MKVLVTLLLVVLAIAVLPEQAEAVNIAPCTNSCRKMRKLPRKINVCVKKCKTIGKRKRRREKNCLSEF